MLSVVSLLPLALRALAVSEAPLVAVPRTEVVLRIDPAAHRLEATALVAIPQSKQEELELELDPSFRILDVWRDGEAVSFEIVAPEREGALARIRLGPGRSVTETPVYRIRYQGIVHDPPRVAQFSRDRIADQTRGTIQEEGVFLSPQAGWYPRIAGELRSYRLEVQLPAGWDAVAEGSVRTREDVASGVRLVFETAHPLDGLHLVAGRWRRIESEHEGVVAAVYVYPDDADLAQPYLAAIKRYLDLYSSWFGPFAWDRFAVVENFFSTGYGMAGFTLLGQDVMRLPFIVDTSLGHEVAHAWWGNAVYVEEGGGNWCEGLTTFVADYHYRRMKGAESGAEYRREVCRDYTNYVSESGSDFALNAFTERTTPATRAVGYGKTMMLFHMLETRLGKERFDAVLRRVYRENLFRRVSWATWRAAFSREAGEDLGWFFDQWIDRPGAPSLSLGEFSVRQIEGASGFEHEVVGTLRQGGGAWRLDVPWVLEGAGTSRRGVVEVREEVTEVRIRVPFLPSSLRVDPDQNVFRRLHPDEMPPVLSRVLGDPKALFVVDDTSGDGRVTAYREMAETLTRGDMGTAIDASRVTPELMAGRNVFLLGLPNVEMLRALVSKLPSGVSLEAEGFTAQGGSFRGPGDSLLVVARRPDDPARAVALFHGLSAEAVRTAGRKLVHYGKYSFLAFVDGKNQVKGVATVEGGPLALGLIAVP